MSAELSATRGDDPTSTAATATGYSGYSVRDVVAVGAIIPSTGLIVLSVLMIWSASSGNRFDAGIVVWGACLGIALALVFVCGRRLLGTFFPELLRQQG